MLVSILVGNTYSHVGGNLMNATNVDCIAQEQKNALLHAHNMNIDCKYVQHKKAIDKHTLNFSMRENEFLL